MSSSLRRPKCKDHPFELGPGVCASCLRLRLLALLDSHHHPASPPPPLLPPPSAPHRLQAPRPDDPLFYSTPQPHRADPNKKRRPRLPSWLSALLGRSRKPARPARADPDDPFDPFSQPHSCPSLGYTPSPAWRVAAPTPARRSAWLSPLWGRPGRVVAGDVGSSGELAARPRRRRHGSDAGGIPHSRSRKLVDIGRLP